MRRLILVAAIVASATVSSMAGCVPHRTGATEIGVRTNKLSANAVQEQIYPQGGVYFLMPFVTDWHTFDTAVQNLEMVADTTRGDRAGNDTLVFKTVDGNDISVDVTVSWRINPTRAPYILQFVSDDLDGVRDKLVRPMARTIVRDVLNQLRSEDYYTATTRFEKAEEARALLNTLLTESGVTVEQVLLGEHRFRDEYEQVIRDKKVAEQEAQRLQSEAGAAAVQWERNLETERGRVSALTAEADGAAQERKLLADAIFFERQRESEALLAEGTARAEGMEARNAALSGSGGRIMVKRAVAAALQGKRILFLPGGSGGDLRVTDVNELLGRYAATRPAPARSAAAQSPE